MKICRHGKKKGSCPICINEYQYNYYHTHKERIKINRLRRVFKTVRPKRSAPHPVTKNIPKMFIPEYNNAPPVNEVKLEITETYCSVFGCGKKLKPLETLYGNKCFEHTVKLIRGKDYL